METVFYHELIVLDFKAISKDDCFTKLSNKFSDLKFINDKLKFIEGLNHREAEYSTSIGDYIAIPHCISDAVSKPFISYARLTSPIEWKSSVSECSEVIHIFLIGMNENKEATHLQMLALLARNLMHENFRNKLFFAKTENEVFEILETIQKSEVR